MQSKTIRKKIWPKLLTAILAVALVFSMTPIGSVHVYAQDDNGSIGVGGNVMKQELSLSANDVDELMTETEFFGANKKDNGATHSVTGVYFTDLLDYVGLKPCATIEKVDITTYTKKNGEEVFSFMDSVETADVNAKTYPLKWLTDPSEDVTNVGQPAMIAYEWIDGETTSDLPRLYIGGFETMTASTNFPGDYQNRPYWYEGITSIEVTGTLHEIKVGGNVMKQELSLSANDVDGLLAETEFFGANKKDNGATHSVIGVCLADLVDHVGLKPGAAIDTIKITTNTEKNGVEVFSFMDTVEIADVDAKTYPLKWLTDPSEDVSNEGQPAMIAYGWIDGESVSYLPRLYIGGFSTMTESTKYPGDYQNRPYWYEGITSIEVVGTVPSVSIGGNVMQKEVNYEADDVSGLLKETEFFGANKKDNGATHSVTGALLTDLIDNVGLKSGATIETIKITTNTEKNGVEVFSFMDTVEVADIDAKTYPLKWLTDPSEDVTNEGLSAMIAYKWVDGETISYLPRLYLGGFKTMTESTKYPGDYQNRPYWYEGITSIEVVGTVPETKPAPAPAVKDGQTVTVEGNTYTVLSASAGTVAFTKAKNTKRAIVPVSVKVDGKTYKVTQVNANAFTGSKIKSAVVNKNVKKIKKNAFKNSKAVQLIVKTKKLTKKSVKGSLKGSKIKKVVVKVGSKKANKKYVKKYKKYFTKKNAGKKVKVVKAN